MLDWGHPHQTTALIVEGGVAELVTTQRWLVGNAKFYSACSRRHPRRQHRKPLDRQQSRGLVRLLRQRGCGGAIGLHAHLMQPQQLPPRNCIVGSSITQPSMQLFVKLRGMTDRQHGSRVVDSQGSLCARTGRPDAVVHPTPPQPTCCGRSSSSACRPLASSRANTKRAKGWVSPSPRSCCISPYSPSLQW